MPGSASGDESELDRTGPTEPRVKTAIANSTSSGELVEGVAIGLDDAANVRAPRALRRAPRGQGLVAAPARLTLEAREALDPISHDGNNSGVGHRDTRSESTWQARPLPEGQDGILPPPRQPDPKPRQAPYRRMTSYTAKPKHVSAVDTDLADSLRDTAVNLRGRSSR